MNFIQILGYTIVMIFVGAAFYGVYYIIKKQMIKAKNKILEEIAHKANDNKDNAPEWSGDFFCRKSTSQNKKKVKNHPGWFFS